MKNALVISTLILFAAPAGAIPFHSEPSSPPGVVLDDNSYFGVNKSKFSTPLTPATDTPSIFKEPTQCIWRESDWTYLFPGDEGYEQALSNPEYVGVKWCPPRGGVPRKGFRADSFAGIIGGGGGNIGDSGDNNYYKKIINKEIKIFCKKCEDYDSNGDDGIDDNGTSSPTPIPLPASGWLLFTVLSGFVGLGAWKRRPTKNL